MVADSPIVAGEVPLIGSPPGPNPIPDSNDPSWQAVSRQDGRVPTAVQAHTPSSPAPIKAVSIQPSHLHGQHLTQSIASNKGDTQTVQQVPLPSLPLSLPQPTPIRVKVKDDIQPIPLSQPYLNLNPTLNTESRQLPPLRSVTPYWSTTTSQSKPISRLPSPMAVTPNIVGHDHGLDPISGSGGGWTGRAGLTPYSRPGSRGADLRRVSTTSLRGISGRW